MNRILDSIFKRFVGIEEIRWCWKAGENTHLPYIYYFFSNSIRFKSNLKNGEILGETYFCDFLQTVCRIDTNDTALESYGKCASSSYKNVFLIPYGLKMNSNTVKFDFERVFCKKFVEMGQIIYRWIAIESAKLSHAERFFYFTTV